MKRYIKIFIATALVVIVFTSCTDEADVLDNTPIKNKKTTEENLRPYSEFEEINIEAESVVSLLSDFNLAMRDEISMPNMQIDTALLLMETYFNYGVVDKQSEYDLSSTYDETSFELTLNLQNENELDGSYLKEQFTNFLNNVKLSMSGKYLKFSDLYVSEYDGATITFKLVIPPYTQDEYEMWPEGVPVVRVLKTTEDPISVPSYLSIDLLSYYISGSGYTARDYYTANLCLKTVPGFYFGLKGEILLPYDPFGFHQTRDGYGSIILTSDILENEAIPSLINYANSNLNLVPIGESVIGLNVKVDFSAALGLKNANIIEAKLSVSKFTSCQVNFGIYFTSTLDNIYFQ